MKTYSDLPNWAELEQEYLHMMTIKNQADARMKEIRSQMEALSEGEDVDGIKLRLTHQERRGTVDYKSIPAIAQMPQSELDKFRKPSTVTTYIKLK